MTSKSSSDFLALIIIAQNLSSYLHYYLIFERVRVFSFHGASIILISKVTEGKSFKIEGASKHV
jgi:hypothetical protein